MKATTAFQIFALPPAPEAPEAPGDPCAPCGACCRDYAVQLSGYDVWRICRSPIHRGTGQERAPEEFVVARVRGAHRPDGFYLAAGGPSYGLVLAKQGAIAPGV